jgi:hypothetical protein
MFPRNRYHAIHLLLSAGLLATLTAGTLAFPAMAEEQEGAAGTEPDFVPLFNGQDFSGWQFDQTYGLPAPPPENWKVEEGVIKVLGGGRPNLGSQWDYDDFEMRFQWRAAREKYNSGFFIRSQRKVGSNQLNLAKGSEGRFIGGKLEGGVAVPQLQKPAMEWNEWRVVVAGDTVKFFCNGQPAWEGRGLMPARGYLGLQAEGAPLDFRNLRIKETGWEYLLDADKWAGGEGAAWRKNSYGPIFQPRGTVRAKPDGKYQDYVLRLEWRAETPAAGSLGVVVGNRLTLVRVGDPDGVVIEGVDAGEVVDNPPGQWNYLQLTLDEGKLDIWQNGKVLIKQFDAAKGNQLVDGGFLSLRCGEPGLQFRNLRIRHAE